MDFSTLTDQQKSELLAYHLDIIRRLRSSMLRSDWHAAFEAALHYTILGFEDVYRLLVEEELGIEPPRADFIVVVDEKGDQRLNEPIFSHFRTHNIIEYKNPNDQLNESVLWKTIGYAGLYISERGVDEKDVTLTIIRARRDIGFFDRMEHAAKIRKGDIEGVYNISAGGVAADRLLPTRIILTDELKGERYAPYRALSNKPKEDDIEYLIDAANNDEIQRKYLRVILNLVAAKHPEMIEEIKGRDEGMTAKWMEIFKDEIGEKEQSARTEGKIQAYAEMVDDGDLTVERAAEKLGMTVQEFQKAVEKIKVTA